MTYGLVCTLSGNVRSGKLTAWLKFLHGIDPRHVAVYIVDNSGSDDFFQELVAESLQYSGRFDKLTFSRFHKVRDASDRVSSMVSEDLIIHVNDGQPVYADVIFKAHQEGCHTWNMPIPDKGEIWEKKIGSFCTVATYNMMAELALMIDSLERHHQGTPLVVFGDEKIRDYMAARGGVGVTFCEIGNLDETRKRYGLDAPKQARWPSVIDPNPHRPEIINIKMDAMAYAINEYGDTMFLDADIILTRAIFAPVGKRVALSPHFNAKDKELTIGRFNAGMVWTDDQSFPGWWRHGFWEDSLFFEQECLNRIGGTWSIAEYPEHHNYGFWRMFSLGKCSRMVDIPDMCKALKLAFTPDGPTLMGELIGSWHVHPFSSKTNDVALTEVMKYLLRNSGDSESEIILKGLL